MPSQKLKPEEWQLLTQNVPTEFWNLGDQTGIFIEKSKSKKLKVEELNRLVPFISEEIRAYLPLRDKDTD